MAKVRVLGLRGCSHCQSLAERLDKFDIDFTFIDVNQHDTLANSVEDFLNVDEYPIVILEVPKISYYIYRGDNYESLNEVTTGRVVKKGCFTTEDMAVYIKKLIH